ncbi:carbohydrate ABC transporter permease [Paenibacillus lignilyticus]|uniref:Carbohydrate ABC transporter permease n=1 Tax=Paenibacillus lignilyticus TaxID=1172615 RepID=A0ABS5CJ33_9BACL|nr:carbohydrate ABC transporter permease [Paenibacillus lignilyticus]MBP3965816.1 carbohydrate ABC transporter permease [Paenibacillus lignilyticus]
MSRWRRSLPGNAIYYTMFALIFVIVFVPIVLVVFGAFKTRTELFQTTPLALPSSFLNFSNFKLAYTQGDMLRGLWNTTIIAFITLCGNAILGTMTAYILNRFQFKLKKVVYGLFLVAMIIPAYTTEIARFQIIHSIGMYDALSAPILIYIGTDIMQIYIYMQFLEKISSQLDESAMLDGATYVRIFRSIIFPLLLPATATLAILKSVTVMNDVYIPFLYMPSKELVTMSTALMKFVGARGSDLSALCAGIVLVLIPSAAVYIAFQRFIFKGLMDGAVKG